MIRDVTWNTFGRQTLERVDSEDGHEIVMATNYLGRVGTWEDDDFIFIQHFHMYLHDRVDICRTLPTDPSVVGQGDE